MIKNVRDNRRNNIHTQKERSTIHISSIFDLNNNNLRTAAQEKINNLDYPSNKLLIELKLLIPHIKAFSRRLKLIILNRIF